jgi:alpha-glucosidase (family GH31 glycosyl hydrolase)
VKDSNGNPYMVPNTAFDVGMLDLTHPKTSTWFKHILLEMVDDGVRGWMADFGEGLPVDAVLYSGFHSHIFLTYSQSNLLTSFKRVS